MHQTHILGITSETLGLIFHCVYFALGQKTPYFFRCIALGCF